MKAALVVTTLAAVALGIACTILYIDRQEKTDVRTHNWTCENAAGVSRNLRVCKGPDGTCVAYVIDGGIIELAKSACGGM